MNLKALFLLPFLLLGTLANSLPPIIRITTNDDKEFELTKEEYELSTTLVDMLDDVDGMGTEFPVPLPNVSARSFKLLKKYIQKYIKACDQDTQKNSTRARAIVSAELREFVMLEDLVELLQAANYLGCEILLEIVRQAIASGIHHNHLDVASAHRILSVVANLPVELNQAVAYALINEDFIHALYLHRRPPQINPGFILFNNSVLKQNPEIKHRMNNWISQLKHNMLIPHALILVWAYNAHTSGTKLVLHAKEDKVFVDALAELGIPFLELGTLSTSFLNSMFTISQPTQDYTLIAGTIALALAAFTFLKK